jgi:hypothetical protein
VSLTSSDSMAPPAIGGIGGRASVSKHIEVVLRG